MKAEQMLLLAAIFAICVPYGKLLSNFWLYVCHCHFNSNSMCLFRSLFYRFKECGPLVYGHFGPKTLRTQDISAPVPKCLGHFGTVVVVPKCLSIGAYTVRLINLLTSTRPI